MTETNGYDREKYLVQKLAHGNEDAFCELYSIYKDRIFYFTLKFIKSREASEDICQEVFIALWQNRNFIDINCSFSAYLYTITRNRILNLLRDIEHQDQVKKIILNKSIDYNEDTQEKITENELKKVLKIALSKLTDRQKQIFELSRDYHLSHKEIAEKLDISVFTVQEHISAAIKIIHHTLKNYYGKEYMIILLILALNIK